MLGNSGCSLKFDHDKNIVIKGASASYPVDRLYKQYTKAKYFISPHNYIKSPKIREWTAGGSFKMDMVYGYNFLELAKYKTLEELYKYADIIFEFIQREFDNCDQILSINDKLLDKIDSIKNFLVKEDFNIICDLIEKNKIHLPIGKCHGDLTFSNMVFKGEEIYLLDFLDSFIDSPVIDIVKLQQDTIYKWSPCLMNIKFEKINKWFDYLNSLLDNYSTEEWYNNNILHIINLCRIIPYTQKNERILGYLYSCINQTISFCQYAEEAQDSLMLDLSGF